MADEEKKLNILQERFCQEFIIDGNATQAAIRAGYSEDSATQQSCKLRRIAHISERIAQLESDRLLRTQITADSVLIDIKAVAKRCMQAEPVMVREHGEWVESGEYKFDSSGANKALENLAKHLKLFTDNNSGNDEKPKPLNITINTVDSSVRRD